ncbi:MAG: hypothetical protein OQL20_00585 [Sedimenticola sp.]|nr:hypothetical protein [Sedimenticola sp.]
MKVSKIARAYLVVIGISVNILFSLIVGYAVYGKVTSHWRWKQFVQLVDGPVDKINATLVEPVDSGTINTNYFNLPTKKWIKIHQQTIDDSVHFKRQTHAGSAFDTNRGRMIIYGSDTHGQDWSNQLRIFDLAAVQWLPEIQADDFLQYTVNENGIPIAKPGILRPWAMHTFDAVEYDSHKDRLIVASHPKHLAPGRFGNWMGHIWSEIQYHPTWLYEFKNSTWNVGKGNAVSFFPYATAYSTKTNEIIGFRPNGIFKLTDDKGWLKIGNKSVNAYHTNAVFDSINNAFVIFGGNTLSNSIHVYRHGDERTQEQKTPGIRPVGTQSSPVAFHPGIGKTVVLVDTPESVSDGAETWLYDLTSDSWVQMESAFFPFKLGMNYNMQYDTYHNQLVLIASTEEGLPSVWVLRL